MTTADNKGALSLPVRGINDLRVLLIDDSEQMLSLLRSFLAIIGARDVREAQDVESAYRVMRSGWPHVVITDLKMRPVNGMDFIKSVRAGKDVKDAKIPIIVVTGFADIQTVDRVMAAGATGILVKPVSLNALRGHIEPLVSLVCGEAEQRRA